MILIYVFSIKKLEIETEDQKQITNFVVFSEMNFNKTCIVMDLFSK